jgi:hypothetical protein
MAIFHRLSVRVRHDAVRQGMVEAQKNADPAHQHPLHVWRKQAFAFMQKQAPRPDGTFAGRPNGPMAACNNFYYDLYTVDDNSLLDGDLLDRLKHRDQFQGALHELFSEATCLRAGFTVIRENEKDPNRRHVEFMAVHKTTGQHVLVEAKSRHRAGVMGHPGRDASADIKFQRLINNAVAKDPNNPLAIFVDTNLPPARANRFYEPRSRNPIIPSLAMAALMDRLQKTMEASIRTTLLSFQIIPNITRKTTKKLPEAVGQDSSRSKPVCPYFTSRRWSISLPQSTSTAMCRLISHQIGIRNELQSFHSD